MKCSAHVTGNFHFRPIDFVRSGLLCLVLILPPIISAQTQSAKQNLLHRIALTPSNPNFAIVSAKLRLGIDVDGAYKQLDTLLSRAYGDMFWMYGCAGLYYATQDVLRPTYKERIRRCWKHFTPYRGDTENHFLMYYGSLFLMSQTWPNLTDKDWFMGKSSREIYAESKEYLDHWMDETVRFGQTEWDSPRYGYYYITPLVLLAEYTKDAHMKHRFEMMLEYMLADYAADYLNGCYCGAHSRVSDECATDPRSAEVTSYGEYFFDDSVKYLQPDVAFAAMSSFECPEIIRHIANDRSEPYEQFSLKRGRQMIRYMNKWSASDSSHDSGGHAPVYKYDYMTQDYCLGSMQGGIVQPIQQQSWSLVFNSHKPHNIITGLHPYVSAEELGMFFPEYPSFMLERIGDTKKEYKDENKWVGGSPYEKIYQDKNVLVALYDLPDSATYHHVDIFIPNDARELIVRKPQVYRDSLHPAHREIVMLATQTSAKSVEESETGWLNPGWQAFEFDSTLVGIWAFSDCERIREHEGLRLQMDSAKTGYLIYCANTREIHPEVFAEVLMNTGVRREDSRIVSTDGQNTINISLNRPKDDDGIFKSKFLQSKKGSGILTMRYKDGEHMLDFTAP